MLDFLLHKLVKSINLLTRSRYKDQLRYSGDISLLPPISVVIPLIEKDLDILELNVTNLKRFCQNPIEAIYVVSPSSTKIQLKSESLNVSWVDESTIAPIAKQTIQHLLGESFRVNWFYQQFLKLNFDKISSTDQYLILDADTVLLSEQYFVSPDHMVLKISDEFHFQYQITNKKLLPDLDLNFRSFIAHHQLISKDILLELKHSIEAKDEQALWTKLLFTIKDNSNWFSEYELYGAFASKYYSNKIRTIYWHNKNLYRKHFSLFDLKGYEKKYASISFHNHNYAQTS